MSLVTSSYHTKRLVGILRFLPWLLLCVGEQRCELVECADPARTMGVPHRLVVELRVRQRQLGAVRSRAQLDRDQRLPLRGRYPVPRENKPPLRLHLAIDAAAIVLLAIQREEHDAKPSARTRIGLGTQQRTCVRLGRSVFIPDSPPRRRQDDPGCRTRSARSAAATPSPPRSARASAAPRRSGPSSCVR